MFVPIGNAAFQMKDIKCIILLEKEVVLELYSDREGFPPRHIPIENAEIFQKVWKSKTQQYNSAYINRSCGVE